MGKFLSHIASLTRRFCQAVDGVAAVEFAIVLPVMITLYVGSVEASRALTYDRRLETAAASLGDLVAQSSTDITVSELNDLFTAAKTTIAPHDASGVRQTVTCVRIDDDGDTEVMWSRGYNGGSQHTVGAEYDLPQEFVDISGASFVIVSEAELDYAPLTGIVFPDGFTLSSTNFYLPRFGGFIDVVPG